MCSSISTTTELVAVHLSPSVCYVHSLCLETSLAAESWSEGSMTNRRPSYSVQQLSLPTDSLQLSQLQLAVPKPW